MPTRTPTKRASFECDACGHTNDTGSLLREEAVESPRPCANPDCDQEYEVTYDVTRTTESARDIADREEAERQAASAAAEEPEAPARGRRARA